MNMLCYIIIVFCLFSIVCLIVRTNNLIKKTNYYKNEYRFVEKINSKTSRKVEVINLGSTCSQFACQSYDDFIYSSKNLGLFSQQLIYDYKLLKKHSSEIKENAIVMIFIIPEVLILENSYSDGTGYHNAVLPIRDIKKQDRNIIKKIKYNFPIINLKHIVGIMNDTEEIDINSLYHMSIGEDNDKNMQICSERWANQLHLTNLIDVKFDAKITKSLEENINILKLIINYCNECQFQPIFVAPPFSEKLNKYISDSFEKSFMIYPIQENFKGIPFLNFMRHNDFQGAFEYYNDGGFLLNKSGSKKFLKLLFSEIERIKPLRRV